MNIIVNTICWNEEKMLPFFLKYYEQFASEIIVHDNYSTDESPQIIKKHPKAKLKHFFTGDKSREDVEIKVKGHAWKKYRRADWVINVDIDEYLYHPDLLGFLDKCKKKGITAPTPKGYEMISDRFPNYGSHIFEQVQWGMRKHKMDKMAIFDPREIQEVNYGPGCHPPRGPQAHMFQPKGNIVSRRNPDFKLLHFKFLGFEYVRQRYEVLGARKSQEDIACTYGMCYFDSARKLMKRFNKIKANSVKVV